ncbi:hypothetical protein SUGI_0473180 [Cryptomeria japonica]|nr:hypothetical protein SUGI_0473180 [Cryptomeria japonica]
MWQALSLGWMKLNFDGASRGHPGWSGMGAIIRNEVGEVVRAISGPVEIATNNVAEISALEAGLRWCVNNGVVKLVIEGDSQVILNGDYHIQHMFREGNKAANYLANMGIEEDFSREFGRDDMMPTGLKEIISLDLFSIPKSGIGKV